MTLYNAYSLILTTKKLWASLNRKYTTEDASTKKFIVGRFFEYKIVVNKIVINLVQEFQLILYEIETEGIILPETFQVATIIEKLPPAWRDFKNYLKYKHKDMKLKISLWILGLRRTTENPRRGVIRTLEAKANVIEDSKGKASTPKGLKWKKAALGYKGKD